MVNSFQEFQTKLIISLVTAFSKSKSISILGPGETCNRPCTGPSKICVFNFEASVGETSPDMADGRVREFLSFNKILPGPRLQVCEGDTVFVKLKNNIEVNFHLIHYFYMKSLVSNVLPINFNKSFISK